MRPIDADALKEELGIAEDCDDCERLGAHGCVNSTWAIICDRIESAPTIDAVPVVRCKDCKCWAEWANGTGSCNRFALNWIGTDADDFCSMGEKRR